MKIVINGEEIEIGGGTGGGTVQWEDINGRPDLSTVSSMVTAPIVLNASLWNESNRQTIPVDGSLADEEQQLVIVKPKRASRTLFNSCGIECVDQTDGALVFECKTVPEADISVNAFLFGAAEIGEEYAGEFAWWSPEMTSDNTPAPYVASMASVFVGYPAYLAFDNLVNTFAHSNGFTDDTVWWIQFDFGKPTATNAIRILARQETKYISQSPSTGEILGSNDGNKWDILYSFSNVPTPEEQTYQTYEFENSRRYRYYRLSVNKTNYTDTYGKFFCAISKFEFLKEKEPT